MGTDHSYRYVKIPENPIQVATGICTCTKNGSATPVTVGFRPTFIAYCKSSMTSVSDKKPFVIYNQYSGAYQMVGMESSTYMSVCPLSSAENYRIKSITDTGFIIHAITDNSTVTFRWVAAKFPQPE